MPFKEKYIWSNETKELVRLSSEGRTFKEIGEIYGVSKQWIEQIFKKYSLEHIGIKKRTTDAGLLWQLKWGITRDKTELYDVQRAKFRSKKANCRRENIEFEINFGEIEWSVTCPALGIELNYFSEGRTDISPSFDRLDPTKGYIPGNVRIISWRANRIKNDGSADELRRIAAYIDAA